RTYFGGILPHAFRTKMRDRAGYFLCALCGPAVVRNVQTGFEGSEGICRRSAREVPRQNAGVQLLAFVQLAEAALRNDDCELPAGAWSDGIQVPVHHPCW